MSKTVTATTSKRDARDALAESIRLEAIGAEAHPSWADWWEEGREPMRRRADQIIRMLRQRGFDVVPTGEDTPAPASMSDIVYSYPMEGTNTVRAIRVDRATKQWQVVQFEGGQEKIEISFKLADAIEYAGLVLIGSAIPLKVPRVGLILAALAEIHRVYATAMTGEGGRAAE